MLGDGQSLSTWRKFSHFRTAAEVYFVDCVQSIFQTARCVVFKTYSFPRRRLWTFIPNLS